MSSVVVLRSVFTHVQTQGKEQRDGNEAENKTESGSEEQAAAEQAAGAPLSGRAFRSQPQREDGSAGSAAPEPLVALR